MYLEFRHLKTIKAIHEQGGLGRAADTLNITQSALSHQIKALEEQVGMELFLRRSKPLKLSKAGFKLLDLAEKVLPQVAATEEVFAGLIGGTAGRMHIAIECHACFEWLFPVLENFRKSWPKIDIDIKPGLSFDALPALQREEVDVVISSDPEDLAGIEFQELFDYTPTFVCATDHPLASKDYIEAEDFRDQTLITYPMDKARLDIFSEVLIPARIEPAQIRQAELTAVIILLIASGRGVSVLPDWVVEDQKYGHDFATKPVTKNGLTRRLYAAVRKSEADAPFMKDFVGFTRAERKAGE
ncbi:LysR family transcriptional regulator [Amylibacter marinus]|uniref:HTH-type transcriptional regulator MetR n=1 Tax=Amylibacter marinus TaxID=1475483 RepID=A0ABQ5VR51_9RHOB|nr:LysR family transcriptional regulator [Amylibacter marinus]GLQ33886.1 LysR family transcriptional regulator [Amylibacter marinus]